MIKYNNFEKQIRNLTKGIIDNFRHDFKISRNKNSFDLINKKSFVKILTKSKFLKRYFAK